MYESFTYWFKHTFLMLPMLASEHGERVDDFLMYVHWLMLVLFVGWSAFFLYTLWRFQRKRQPTANATGVRTHASTYVEIGVVVTEGFLLLGLAIPLWASVVSNPPAENESTMIRVMGRQFNWMAHYPGVDGIMGRQNPAVATISDPFGVDRLGDEHAMDDVVVQNNLVVPVDRPVLIHLTSMDVIHGFAIKTMRVSQDAIPGMSIATWFTPTREGEFKITCSQLCGNSHYGMFGILKVVSQEAYDVWLADASAKARAAAAAGAVDYE
jgi:cytochrome c oxidase subunit II